MTHFLRKPRFYLSRYNPIHSKKIRPNDPCPSGSGKKAKNCCGTETQYYKLKSK